MGLDCLGMQRPDPKFKVVLIFTPIIPKEYREYGKNLSGSVSSVVEQIRALFMKKMVAHSNLAIATLHGRKAL